MYTYLYVYVCVRVWACVFVYMCIFIIKKWMCVFVCVLYVIVFYHFVWMYAYMNMCLWVYWYLRVCCCTVALFLVCDYACIYMCVCVFMCFYMKICVCVCFCLGGDLLIPVYTCIYSAGKPETSSALPWSCIVPGCWGVGGGRRARTNHSPPCPSPTNHRPPNSGSEASPRPLGLPPALAQAPAVLPAHQLPYLRPNLGSVLDSNWL